MPVMPSTEKSRDRAHKLLQEKHQLQAALREALRWIAHQQQLSSTHHRRLKHSKTLAILKTILSQHNISESDIENLLRLSAQNTIDWHAEKILIAHMESMIKKIQAEPHHSLELDHTPHLLQSTAQLQQQANHLWKLNAQLWEENQRLVKVIAKSRPNAGDSNLASSRFQQKKDDADASSRNNKLHQLIREKTQLVEQLSQLKITNSNPWPADNQFHQQLNYLRAENLALLRKYHEASTRATQLEHVLHLNREAWVSTSDRLPDSPDIYWISDGETVWRSFFNLKLEAFEDAPAGILPRFWMPIIKPCPPLHRISP